MDIWNAVRESPVCKERILSNEYADFVISYNGDVRSLEYYFEGECLQIIDNQLAILTTIRENQNLMQTITYAYYTVPKCYGLMDTTSMEASGIIRLQNQPVLNLKGRGILVGLIDTGIDYQNPLFLQADGTTRIRAIWDQTIQSGASPEGFYYGTEFTEEMIDEALRSERPLEMVPSVDDSGHGTFAAGIAAGGEDESGSFTGAAPMADIVVVKLKKAKQYLKDFYRIDAEEVYQETDIIRAVYYLYQQAIKRNQQISIYLGVGTNSGEHAGRGVLNQYLNRLSQAPGVFLSLPVGNEGNARHHFSGMVAENSAGGYEMMELNVGADDSGFVMEIWGETPNTYAVGIESPYGEVIARIPPQFRTQQRFSLLFERTIIEVAYVLVEELSGKQLIFIRMEEPTEGIWRFRIYSSGNVENRFHAWLPIRGFMNEDTFFLSSSPDVTLTEPSTAEGPACSTAYNHLTDSLYMEAGRGYTSEGGIKPDLAAPGVEVYGPALPMLPGQKAGYTRRSGTSIAAAHTAGAAALMMEWIRNRGIVRMNGVQIKRYLIRGANRIPELQYPNPLWGYGTLDLYATFQGLQQRDTRL